MTRRTLGVLSGTDMKPDQVRAWAESADLVLAADGGANVLHSLGIRPGAIIGDYDSIAPEARVGLQLEDRDQDSSDCDKLLRYAERIGCLEITLCNVEGDLPDHFLGTIQSALKSSLQVRMALRRGLGIVLKGPIEFKVDSPMGARVSLIPLEKCEDVDLLGTQWALSKDSLAPDGSTSLSNRAVDSSIKLNMRSGSAVLFLIAPLFEKPEW